MANWDLQLISALLSANDGPAAYTKSIERGITSTTFGNLEARTCWEWISYHYNRQENFGHIPSRELFKQKFPFVDLPRAVENFEDLCSLVTSRHMQRRADRFVEAYQDTVRDEPQKAIADLWQELGALQEQASSSGDISFEEVAIQETLEEMNRLDICGGLSGMPWPWEIMNEASGGIQPGDLILVYAMPKSMKTWFGLIISAHLAKTGRRVLIYSKEMMWRDLRRRLACIMCKIDYTKLKKGLLSRVEKLHIVEVMEKLVAEGKAPIIFTTADRPDGSPGGPDEIRAKIQKYKPEFVMLDSAYMLELPGSNVNPYDWKSLAVVNRKLKQICKSTGIPILAVLQENERQAYKYKGTRGTASLAMNTSAIQDCDLALRLVKHSTKRELTVYFAAARETEFRGFTINANAAEDFSFSSMNLHEIGDDFKEGAKAASESKSTINKTVSTMFSMVQGFTPEEGPEADETEEDLAEEPRDAAATN